MVLDNIINYPDEFDMQTWGSHCYNGKFIFSSSSAKIWLDDLHGNCNQILSDYRADWGLFGFGGYTYIPHTYAVNGDGEYICFYVYDMVNGSIVDRQFKVYSGDTRDSSRVTTRTIVDLSRRTAYVTYFILRPTDAIVTITTHKFFFDVEGGVRYDGLVYNNRTDLYSKNPVVISYDGRNAFCTGVVGQTDALYRYTLDENGVYPPSIVDVQFLDYRELSIYQSGSYLLLFSANAPYQVFIMNVNNENEFLTIRFDGEIGSIYTQYCCSDGENIYMKKQLRRDNGYDIVSFNFTVYANKYTLYNNDGSKKYFEYRYKSDLKKVLFRKEGDKVVYTLTTVTEVIEGEYTPELPENNVLLGYTDIEGGDTYIFRTDETVRMFDPIWNFYEVYGDVNNTYTPLWLFKNRADDEYVDKTTYMEKVGNMYGVFRDEVSLTNPVITIQHNGVPKFNYVYIPAFDRYYYVDDIVGVRYDLWEITLSVDVLMTYKEGIYKLKGMIDRCENDYNPFIIDKKVVVEEGYDYEAYEVSNNSVFDKNYNTLFVLTGTMLVTEGEQN